MISQCSICDEPYSTKDFTEARKRVCPDCAAKATKDDGRVTKDDGRKMTNEGRIADGRMPTLVPPAVSFSGTTPKSEPKPKSSGMAGSFVPKPDDKFNQRPLVWAK